MTTLPRISRNGRAYRQFRDWRNRAIIAGKRLSSVAPTAYVNRTSTVARDLIAEDYVFVGPGCSVAPLVSIGRYSMLGPQVAIVGDDHHFDRSGVPLQFTGRPDQRPTTIGADVWVGQASIILRGVSIGDGAIIGAGAVVTHDVPAYEIWSGVPARRQGVRFPDPQDRARHEAMLVGPLVRPTFVEPQLWLATTMTAATTTTTAPPTTGEPPAPRSVGTGD